MERYLRVCVNSILAQTHDNLEVILVDDGSTDTSPMICDEYGRKDKRVVVIHKENGGQGSARNMALDIAKGEYIGFVDSDDWIEVDMYEHMLSIAVDRNAEFIICESVAVMESGEIKRNQFHYGELIMDTFTAMKHCIDGTNIVSHGPCNKLFHAKLFKTIRFTEGRLLEDTATTYRLIDLAKTIVYTGTPKYFVRCVMESVSRRKFNLKREDVITSYEEMEQFFLDNEKYNSLVPYSVTAKLGAIITFIGNVYQCDSNERKYAIHRIQKKCRQALKSKNYNSFKQIFLLKLIVINPKFFSWVYKLFKGK
jgi:glycosyltransferase involved in cell wall biosynthesis